MDEHILANYAKSFRGKLYQRALGSDIPLRLSHRDDKFTWQIPPEDDWLQAGGRKESPVMDFRFDSRTEDRLHYHISIASAAGIKKLGVSRNGYLGFYLHAKVTDYWKIEPLHLSAEGLLCHLRDQRGYRVGAIPDGPHRSGDKVDLLNVDEGQIVTFLLKPTN